MERKKVGEVFHYYGHIGVAAIRLTDGMVAVGDTIQIQGPTTDLEQTVDSLQIEHAEVTRANRGEEVGMKVRDRVRERDFVYKLVPSEAPLVPPPPRSVPPPPPEMPAPVVPSVPKPARPKAKPKKPARPRRKGPRRAKPRVRKTSRARRSKGRRESRRPRSR